MFTPHRLFSLAGFRAWLISGTAVLLLIIASGCERETGGDRPVPTSSASPAPPAPTAPTASAKSSPAPTSSPSAAAPKPSVTPTPAASPLNGNVPSAQAKAWIAERAAEVLQALQERNLKKLAGYVHPELGVRLSPYAHVDKKTDRVWKADQLAKADTDKTLYTWGAFDGSGEPIRLTFEDYYNKFVYDHDFARPEKLSYNEGLSHGNTIDNLRETYPKAIFVEAYFSGFDPKLEGMDWASLKLVFEHTGTGWYLVGLVHGQWTI